MQEEVNTNVDPKSGCNKIIRIGIPATISTRQSGINPGRYRLPIKAIINIVEILLNSIGWKLSDPSLSHRLAPNDSSPITKTNASRSKLKRYPLGVRAFNIWLGMWVTVIITSNPISPKAM
jgi:hypothetical protein